MAARCGTGVISEGDRDPCGHAHDSGEVRDRKARAPSVPIRPHVDHPLALAVGPTSAARQRISRGPSLLAARVAVRMPALGTCPRRFAPGEENQPDEIAGRRYTRPRP